MGIRTAHAHAWQYDGGSGSGGGGDGENGGDGRGGDHCVVAQNTSVCRRRWRRQTRTSATVHDSFMAPARNGIAAAGTVLLWGERLCVGGGNVGTQPIYTAIRTEDVRGINLPIRPPSQHSRFRDGQARIHRRAESIISVSSSSDPRPHPPESSESSPPDSSEFIIDVILILASFSSVPSSCLPPHPSLVRHTSLPPSVLRPPSTLMVVAIAP